MKCISLFLIVFFNAVLGIAQNSISTLTFSTNYSTNSINTLPITYPILYKSSDSLIGISFLRSLDSNNLDQRIRYIIKTSTFSLEDTIIDWSRDSRSLFSNNNGFFAPINLILEDRGFNNNSSIFFDSYTRVDSLTEVKLYSILNEQKDSILASLNFERFIKNEPFLLDSIIYLFTENFSRDTAFVESFHLSNFSYPPINSFAIPKINYPIELLKGPVRASPISRDKLLFTSSIINRVHLFDINIFQFVDSVELSWIDRLSLANSRNWGSNIAYDYAFDTSGVTISGYIDKWRDLNDSSSIDHQKYYTLNLSWSGNVVSANEYGEKNVKSQCYAMEKVDSTIYLVGSSPKERSYNYSAEYRKVLIYQIGNQRVDSLLLFGNSNHLGLDVKILNGDVFVLSQNSNAWTNDSVFINITKIPKQVLTSINQLEPKTTSLAVYPNPTSNILKSDAFQAADEYLIFDVQGKLIDEARIKNVDYIDVSSLESGTYFIKLISNEKISQRATMFIKQ